jgi:hypothetical protein
MESFLMGVSSSEQKQQWRAIQSQVHTILGPNTPLHLHYSKEARLTASLQSRDRFRQGLIRVEVQNWNPLCRHAVLRTFPLFDGE